MVVSPSPEAAQGTPDESIKSKVHSLAMTDTSILLRKGRVVDPSTNRDGIFDVLIKNGKIHAIEAVIAPNGATVVDVSGKIVCPGFIDMHVHLREPGFEYKETIASGTRAAAMGGITGVACMPNTNPVIDHSGVVELIFATAKKEGVVRVHPVGSITKKQEGKELSEIADLKSAGIVALSDDGRPVTSSQIMRCALEYAGMFDLPVISHSEDPELSHRGVLHEGFKATMLGLRGIPSAAEEVMVARDIVLCEMTGSALHVAHVSSGGTVRLLREAKARGLKVTAETAPHYCALTDEEIPDFHTHYKMNPPLRSERDREELLEGLADGTIDALATDHAPHADFEKDQEFSEAPFGIIGLESSVGIGLSKLVHGGILTINQFVDKMSCAPARILRLQQGTLAIGADADITVLDLEKEWVIDVAKFQSKSRNCPFDGWKVNGSALITMVGGTIVMRDGKLITSPL